MVYTSSPPIIVSYATLTTPTPTLGTICLSTILLTPNNYNAVCNYRGMANWLVDQE